MRSHAVVIAGGGPTGMMLAAELTLANVDVAVVEKRANHDLEAARAGGGGLHARTIEVLDQRGVAERFLAAGTPTQVQSFGGIPVSISDFPARHNYGLALWQKDFERILGGWIEELHVPMYREEEVTGFSQDHGGVRVRLARGEPIEAQYLVGCDGGRSVVRRTAGIDFAGWDPTVSSLLAEVRMTDEPEIGIRRDTQGQHAIGRRDGGFGVVVTEPFSGQSATPTLDDVREALVRVWGKDFGVHSPTWTSRFTDVTRQAVSYRKGRVLLAGDAAHVHYPVGGQGLNVGVQDAVNLGWKLAQVVRAGSPDTLLDTYHAERHPVGARVLHNTRAATALIRGDDRTNALRETMTAILRMDEPRKLIAGMISGLDVSYDLGKGHPLLGRRVPDLGIDTSQGSSRVYAFLQHARPVLLNFGERGNHDVTSWSDRVLRIDAHYDGAWELPVIGAVSAPDAVLVRPDGHVAWVGDGAGASLEDALTTWFGATTVA